MGGGAWSFLVGGVICLVNSDNERDLNLLTNPFNCIGLRCVVGEARWVAFGFDWGTWGGATLLVCSG
ncbi:MAG: hypothetical protein EZS28_006847 [Streblomastix strix]|uniref:Uncharacterized protein n=1 Tax=Streblomastix strix TaxID=222440 RepID=A0A5J4WRQ4_9EUKA|nr:MAG: hypothetical protein EZS28_006847 [Streblomastix strix]